MNEDYIQDLCKILNKQYNIYKKLAELASEKEKTLLNNDAQKLSEIIKKEKTHLEDLEKYEDKRKDIIEQIAQKQSFDYDNLSFENLLSTLNNNQKNKLKTIRDKLLDIIKKLEEKNDTNRHLLEQALKLNNFSLKMFQQAMQPEQKTYNRPGEKNDDNGRNIIDRKA